MESKFTIDNRQRFKVAKVDTLALVVDVPNMVETQYRSHSVETATINPLPYVVKGLKNETTIWKSKAQKD